MPLVRSNDLDKHELQSLHNLWIQAHASDSKTRNAGTVCSRAKLRAKTRSGFLTAR